jgi:N-acetylmuramoyl-L-alanine amidase
MRNCGNAGGYGLMTLKIGTALLLAITAGPLAASAAQESARTMYESALSHERALRADEPAASLAQLREAAHEYEAIVRRFPASGYSDNALWQAANLERLAFERFRQDVDYRTSVRLLNRLKTQYPSSSLIAQVDAVLAQPVLPAAADVPTELPSAAAGDTVATVEAPRAEPPSQPAPVAGQLNAIREITRTNLPDGVRVTIQLDTESTYYSERLENPRRVFFDVKGARPVPSLRDATLKFPDAVVREIRLGRHPQNTTRIVMDMAGVDSYSVFTLYNPFRLVVDFRTASASNDFKAAPAARDSKAASAARDFKTGAASRAPAALAARNPANKPAIPLVASLSTPAPTPAVPIVEAPVLEADADSKPLPSRPLTALRNPPTLPSPNADGQFSLARQLGLGISRIVIDPGHGGHDPGAQANGVSESELVLDVALRLSKLIEKQTAIEVVMTRDTDVFIPLEERTAIANREGSDLFLSIHANASRSPSARGVESYFLNFASNPAAEAVAARENSTSGRTMHNLPDIVKAIALNNKLDESRDFADMVQRSMVKRLSTRNKQLRDLGVKQAPFVVLIGAAMPSVLAEISFVTHRQEGQLLKTAAYRQQIAEALLDAVLRYQQSLKRMKSAGATLGAR